MNLAAYYINLDHRTDRRDEFQSSFKSLGFEFPISRVSAILDNDFGGLGCAKSHLKTLTDFLTNENHSYCMILEDDFRFRIGAGEFEEVFSKFQNINNANVMLLGGTSVITTGNTLDGIFSEIFESASTSGYIIKRTYVPNLISIFCSSILNMEKFKSLNPRSLIYNRFAIDQAWQSLQRNGNWFAQVPMLGYQTESYSDIEKKIVDYNDISS